MAITQNAPLDAVQLGPFKSHLLVEAGETIHMGQFVAVDTDGYAINPSGTLAVCGVAEAACDNSGGADGDKSVAVVEGLFWRPVDGTNPPVQADIGAKMYAKDNYTVSKASGDGPLLGILYGLDTELGALVLVGMWVKAALTDAT